MVRTCPACGEQALDVGPIQAGNTIPSGIREFRAIFCCYRCSACGWTCKWYTITALQRLGLSAAPEVVYLAELLALKPHQPHIEYSGEYNPFEDSRLSRYIMRARDE